MPGKSIQQFAKEVTKLEKGKQQVSIAQVNEILKVINILMPGFYAKIKGEETQSNPVLGSGLNLGDSLNLYVIEFEHSRKNKDDGDRLVKKIKELIHVEPKQ